jgi:hypothetical protein
LPPEKRIKWTGTDRYINWFDIKTKEDVENKYRPAHVPGNRDVWMAENIYRDFMQNGQRKSLVIMNYRHSFMNDSWTSNVKKEKGFLVNTANLLKHWMPERVANVWLHTIKIGSITYKPIAGGQLDAAFRVLGNPSLGFDMLGSPLGDNHFEIWKATKHSLTFKDIFHGYVFYNPVDEQRLHVGFPEYFSVPENMEELKRRFGLIDAKMRWNNAKKMENDNEPFPFKQWRERKVKRWIK